MAREKLVILEGPNGSGKSTVRPIVASLLGQVGDHVIDRFVGSYFVYDRLIRKEESWVPFFLDQLSFLQRRWDVWQVTLATIPAEVARRLGQRGSSQWTLEEIEDQQRLFTEWHRLVKEEHIISGAITVPAFDLVTPKALGLRIVEEISGNHPAD